MAANSTQPPTSITLRVPSKYGPAKGSGTAAEDQDAFIAPPPEWLHRTWSVTHSTLPMWRTERNVRISYTPRPAKAGSIPLARNSDMVEWESLSGKGGVKTVAGSNTATPPPSSSSTPAGSTSTPHDTGMWDWRGKGFLFWVSSHWEVLGWGERPLKDGGVERWAVTWFTPSMFTPEGLDIYCDRKEGISEETAGEIIKMLKELPSKELAKICEDMQTVEIKLPWKER